MPLATLVLKGLSKHFKETVAVHDVNLVVETGEFFSILGPSGCGKTTLLRMIAGFESCTSGSIELDGEDITRRAPHRRRIGMVFQNYALFPHMTVFQNVAFGLETRRVSRPEVHRRVGRILDAVHLSDKAHAPVPELSGGEQQRVAVARALVVEPAVLLFDEPLSNLDVTLRHRTREEIREIQRTTRITAIYVTHDQSEAMSLSGRIAVMRSGKIEQVGRPAEIYEAPSSAFVAEFVGGANILKGILRARDGRFTVGGLEVTIPDALRKDLDGKVTVAAKPEALVLSSEDGDWEAIVEDGEYLGFTSNFVVNASGVSLRVSSSTSRFTKRLSPGDRVLGQFDWERCTLFPEWQPT